jgi:hypothetical protein
MTAFGPQLIGTTEKTLTALLRHVLAGTGLDETRWVTLRLAGQDLDGAPLAQVVRERAHRDDAGAAVADLEARGLLDQDALSPAGRALVDALRTRIADLTGPVWADLDPQDVAATERVLGTVTARARQVLATLGP